MKPSRVDLLSALAAAQDPKRTIDSTFWVERILAAELESQRFMWAYDLRFLVGAILFGSGFLGGVFLVKAVLS
jgi:hypothetical protein